MKVALVWTSTCSLVRISVRYERYVRGLRAIGHEPITVCLPEAEVGYAEPTVVASNAAAFCDRGFWRSLDLDAAIAITWLGQAEVLKAIASACPWVVSIADNDGQRGIRVHPRATFARMIGQHTTLGLKLRAAKYWLQMYVLDPGELDRPVVESARYADRVVVGSPAAARHLCRFFRYHGDPDLATKVAAIPYPTDDCFLTGPVSSTRENQVVAIGRWDDPQKDASLLCRLMHRHLSRGRKTRFLLCGPNGDAWFGPLVRRWPHNVRNLGPQAPEQIAEHLRHSRALILTSRWESGPIVLNEALASGCTVVGTDSVSSVLSACEDGGFGTMSAGRSATRLADALAAEMAAWDRGHRDPAAIAARWRPRFEPSTVCRLLLDAREGRKEAVALH